MCKKYSIYLFNVQYPKLIYNFGKTDNGLKINFILYILFADRDKQSN